MAARGKWSRNYETKQKKNEKTKSLGNNSIMLSLFPSSPLVMVVVVVFYCWLWYAMASARIWTTKIPIQRRT